MPAHLQIVRQRIFVAHHVGGREHQRDEQAELEEAFDRAFVAIRPEVIGHARDDSAENDRAGVGERGQKPETRAEHRRMRARQPVRPVEPQRPDARRGRRPNPGRNRFAYLVPPSTHVTQPMLNAAVPLWDRVNPKFNSSATLQESSQQPAPAGQVSLTIPH